MDFKISLCCICLCVCVRVSERVRVCALLSLPRTLQNIMKLKSLTSSSNERNKVSGSVKITQRWLAMPKCLNPTFMRGDLSVHKQNVQKNSIILGSNIQQWYQLNCLGNSVSHQKWKKKFDKKYLFCKSRQFNMQAVLLGWYTHKLLQFMYPSVQFTCTHLSTTRRKRSAKGKESNSSACKLLY